MKIYNYISLLLLIWSIPGHSSSLKVVVMDTGLRKPAEFNKLCKNYNTTKEPNVDFNGHGTNVVGLIAKNAGDSDYCIYNIKAFDVNGSDIIGYLKALKLIRMIKPDILNISAGGSSGIPLERQVIKELLDYGTRVVVAAGNESNNLNKDCNFYPACYDERIVVVGNKADSSNYGEIVDFVIDGNNKEGFGVTLSGSSQSTAIYTGRLIKELSR